MTDGDATKLTSCEDGSALILWIEDAGTSVALGTKWAIVLLQGLRSHVESARRGA